MIPYDRSKFIWTFTYLVCKSFFAPVKIRRNYGFQLEIGSNKMGKEYIVHGTRDTEPIPQESVGSVIYKRLKSNIYSSKPAIIDVTNNLSLSPKELLESTCKLAQWYNNNGIKENDIVVICSENNVNFFTPVIASFYSGVAVATINHTYSERELLHSLNLVKPKMVFCSEKTLPKFESLHQKNQTPYIRHYKILNSINKFVNNIDIGQFQPITVNPHEHIATILFSSGTTGLAKAVTITHENINIRNTHDRFNYGADFENLCSISVTPFYHAYGFMMSLGMIAAGKTLLFMERFNEKKYLEAVQKYRATLIQAVPAIMVFLAKSPIVDQYDLSSVKRIESGAAPLSKEIEEIVKRRLKLNNISQGYGMTEATLGVCSNGAHDKPKSGSCGRPAPHVSVKIRDPDTGKSLPPHSVGEICVKSNMVMKGYYNNDKETKNAFTPDGWLRTGDLGYHDEDGYIFIVDRLKDLIKYKGFQVPPVELEALLLTNPKIQDAAVIGLPDENGDELPFAFIIKKPETNLTPDEVKEFVHKQVSPHKRLRGGVKFVEAIPRNPSGKILRRELRQSLTAGKSKL